MKHPKQPRESIDAIDDGIAQVMDLVVRFSEAPDDTYRYDLLDAIRKKSVSKQQQERLLDNIIKLTQIAKDRRQDSVVEALGVAFWELGSAEPSTVSTKLMLLVDRNDPSTGLDDATNEIASYAIDSRTGQPLRLGGYRQTSRTERALEIARANKAKMIAPPLAAVAISHMAVPAIADDEKTLAGAHMSAAYTSDLASAFNEVFVAAEPIVANEPKVGAYESALQEAKSLSLKSEPAVKITGLDSEKAKIAKEKLGESRFAADPNTVVLDSRFEGLSEDVLADIQLAEYGYNSPPHKDRVDTASNSELSLEAGDRIRDIIEILRDEIDHAHRYRALTSVGHHDASYVMTVLDQASYSPEGAGRFFTDKQKERILNHNYLREPELTKKKVAGLIELKDPVALWISTLEDEHDKELLLAAYASVEVALMSKAERHSLVDFEYAQVPEFVDAKINSVRALEGVVDFSNLAQTPDRIRLQALKDTARELNIQALASRDSLGFGGWDGDTDELVDLIWETAERHKHPAITPELLLSQQYQESRFDSTPRAKSWAGAKGLSQFMDPTWNEWRGRIHESVPDRDNPDVFNPAHATDLQAQYMIWIYENFARGDTVQARLNQTLAGYNAGVGHLQRLGDDLVNIGLSNTEGVLLTTEPAEYQRDINIYLELTLVNINQVAEDAGLFEVDEKIIAEDDSPAVALEQARSPNGYEQAVPRSIDIGTRTVQNLNQHSVSFKDALETNGHDREDIALFGCGPVTIKMIRDTAFGDIATTDADMDRKADEMVEIYEYVMNPANDIMDFGYDKPPIKHTGLSALADHLGLDVQSLPEASFEEIERAFKNGAVAVTMNTRSGDKGPDALSQSGHVYAIVGITEDGNFLVIDSNLYDNVQKEWTPEQLLNYAQISAMHAMSAPGDMDDYKQLAAETFAEQERIRQEQAEQERLEAEAAEQARQEQLRSGDWDPSLMTDGWEFFETLRSNPGLNGQYAPEDTHVAVPGLIELEADRAEIAFTNPEAARAFAAMNEAFRAEFGFDIPVTDAYRPLHEQERLKAEHVEVGTGHLAAKPGTSPHGYGNAVDIRVNDRSTEVFKWMMENGLWYGFANPTWFDPRSPNYDGQDEAWHFEYIGWMANPERVLGGHPEYDIQEYNQMFTG